MILVKNSQDVINELKLQIKAKDKWISELLKKCECPKCGTTELLCGHNGAGCTSEEQ